MSEAWKVIKFCPIHERWLIYVSLDVEEERVEYSGDNAIIVYAKSMERAATLIEKGKSLLARAAARRKRRGTGR